MTARPFQIGDRVSSTIEVYDAIHEGDLGTIVCIIGAERSAPAYGVSWDHASPMLHDCNGYCKNGTGFFVTKERIALYHVPTIDQTNFLDLLRGETYG